MKKAFSLLELVFVIIIISILLSLAIPNITVSRDDALNLKIKSTILSINNSINLLKTKLSFSGKLFSLNSLDRLELYNAQDNKIFYFDDFNSSNILNNPIFTSTKGWMKIAKNEYTIYTSNEHIIFTYTNNKFTCLNNNIGNKLKICHSLMQ